MNRKSKAKRLIGILLGIALMLGLMPGMRMNVYADAGHEHADGKSFANAWTSTNSLPGSSGSYYLTTDVTMNSAWYLPNGTTNLCLNGHSIHILGGTAIVIDAGCVLNLYNCGGSQGTITGNGGGVTNHGTFNMYGGTISDSTKIQGGGGVYSTGTFNMYGGTISDNETQNAGGGVYVGGGTFTMSGGTISGNSPQSVGGGGVYVGGGSSTFNMSGGTISGNSPYNTGGGVYVAGGSIFNMSGGTISNNTPGGPGGGVCVAGGSTFNMSGGTISGNRAQDYGGGVCVVGSSTFNMSGGTISGNTANNNGGGVDLTNGSLCISGNPVITNNKVGDMGENVYLSYNQSITIAGALTGATPIGVREYIYGVFTSGWESKMSGVPFSDYFYSDDPSYGVKKVGNELTLVEGRALTYKANGATSGMVPTDPDSPYSVGSTATVLGNTGNLAKTDYVFGGWNTKADGTGTTYAAGDSFTINAPAVLYARWTHEHDFTYTADGDTITATCTVPGCDLTDNKATLKIAAPLHTAVGDGKSAEARITDTDGIRGTAAVGYYTASGSGTRGTALAAAPAGAGKYWAEITVGAKTAHVVYAIAGEATPAPDEATARAACGINYMEETATPADGYEISADGTDVAAPPVSLTDILDGTGEKKIYVRAKAADDDHSPSEWVPVTLADRPDAPAGLTTKPATDGTAADGEIYGTTTDMEYSSDNGTGWTDADADKTMVNAGTYLLRRKATDHAPAGKAVKVTVGGKKQIILSDDQKPTAKEDLVYSGKEQPLVNAPAAELPEGAVGMVYAVTAQKTDPADTSAYTASIPAGTDAGTYYVWYMAVGDADHTDSEPGCIAVVIAEPGKTYCTVTFDVRGHGTAPDNQRVETGTLAERPADPAAEGWTFVGWYKEAEYINLWDFAADHVNTNVTLYALWTAKPDEKQPDPEPPKKKEQAPAHTHHMEWKTTREATETQEGEMAYICADCGYMEYTVPLSACYVFQQNAINKIRAAGKNATVEITTDRWISFHKSVAEALKERPDVTVTVSFLDDGYRGNRKRFTIPAGADLLGLFGKDNFAGFLYLGGKFGMTPQ